MEIETSEIKITNYRYIPDSYVMPDKYENLALQPLKMIDPFYYINGYEFDILPLTTYEVYTYNLLKTTCNFFSKSSNVVEISTDFGYTAQRYSEYVRHFYIFEPEKNKRDIARHNLRKNKNTFVLDLMEPKQLQNIDTEFMIIRDYGLFIQYRDVIVEKLATVLLKKDSDFDFSYLKQYGYEIYEISCYALLVPFYFDKPINLKKYAK